MNMTVRKKAVRYGLMLLAVSAMTACNDGGKPAETTAPAPAPRSELKIAYVLMDTLTNQYQFCKDVTADLEKKQANAQATLQQKEKNFNDQVAAFQRKVQSNAITQEQYTSEQNRLSKLGQDLQALQARLGNSMQEEQAKQMQAISDTIQSFISSYAKEKDFDFILCKTGSVGSAIFATGNVLYAKDSYDVTEEVVKALNKRYEKDQAKASAKEEKKAEEAK